MKVIYYFCQAILLASLVYYIQTTNAALENVTKSLVELDSKVSDIEESLNAIQLEIDAVDISLGQTTRSVKENNEKLVFPPIKDHTSQAVRAESKASIFLVSGPGNRGTGFQIQVNNKKYVISNAHVCRDEAVVDLSEEEGATPKFTRKVLKRDYDLDLCLIEGVDERPALPIGVKLEVGEKVIVIGHPHAWELAMTEGEVISTKVEEESPDDNNLLCLGSNLRIVFDPQEKVVYCLRKHVDVIRTTVVIFPGSSGSPLLNTKGQVVGVAFMYYKEGAWGSAIPLSHLKEFTKDVK